MTFLRSGGASSSRHGLLLSEHFFDDRNCGVLIVNNGSCAYVGKPSIRSGWSVESAVTDAPDAAKWNDGTLTLAPCAGILLLARK
ncbi:MAG: hypothetical protein IKH04_00705 [Kiritimatiellae bacterium]|nr:hypothetical protein [Kiritimatiellia bacterium]